MLHGFLCMLHLDIVHISSVCVHIICILSEHMCIMHILSALVLHMFFPNRQCQCDLYVISTTLYRSLNVVHTYTGLCYVSFTFLICITCNLVSACCHLDIHHISICMCTYHTHIVILSAICSFLTDNANVIYTTIFIDPYICTHIYTLFVMYLSHSSYSLLPAT